MRYLLIVRPTGESLPWTATDQEMAETFGSHELDLLERGHGVKTNLPDVGIFANVVYDMEAVTRRMHGLTPRSLLPARLWLLSWFGARR